MKKTIWIVLAAAFLLGALGFLLLSRVRDGTPGEASLPSLSQDGASSGGSEGRAGTNENGTQDASHAPDPGASGDTEEFELPTGNELPVDWNEASSAPTQSADASASPGNIGSSSEAGNPGGSSTPGNPGGSSEGPDAAQTESGETPETSEGHIVVPILPPDIFH